MSASWVLPKDERKTEFSTAFGPLLFPPNTHSLEASLILRCVSAMYMSTWIFSSQDCWPTMVICPAPSSASLLGCLPGISKSAHAKDTFLFYVCVYPLYMVLWFIKKVFLKNMMCLDHSYPHALLSPFSHTFPLVYPLMSDFLLHTYMHKKYIYVCRERERERVLCFDIKNRLCK